MIVACDIPRADGTYSISRDGIVFNSWYADMCRKGI